MSLALVTDTPLYTWTCVVLQIAISTRYHWPSVDLDVTQLDLSQPLRPEKIIELLWGSCDLMLFAAALRTEDLGQSCIGCDIATTWLEKSSLMPTEQAKQITLHTWVRPVIPRKYNLATVLQDLEPLLVGKRCGIDVPFVAEHSLP